MYHHDNQYNETMDNADVPETNEFHNFDIGKDLRVAWTEMKNVILQRDQMYNECI